MKYRFSTEYNADEMNFINTYHCKILSEIKLSKTSFSENEIPKRMIQYGGCYIGEIISDDDGSLVWSVLGKDRKGRYIFTIGEFEDLPSMAEGL